MDMLTLAKAKKIAQALVDAVSGDVSGIEHDLDDLVADAAIIDKDGDIAVALLLNRLRQHIWQNEDDALVCEEGSASLTNTLNYPFNGSQKTVALTKAQRNTKYAVIAWIASANGNAGEVEVSAKQVNGFKLAYTGSAKSAVVNYIVIGGIIK